MSREKENTGFICENCGREVKPLSNGSFRNHCPFCLCSKHLDIVPGDRESTCEGIMDPIDIIHNSKKGYQLIHKCRKCGELRKNKIAKNTIQEDNILDFLKKISVLK
ncbi:RNHCP domain-containing protein [Mammaliicoccus sciuri]|uniref:RNHCP domain-containing protein n=1 Tax=Mammaliicoccus sciuri TaxID=1296 RepID=UPI0034DCF4FD